MNYKNYLDNFIDEANNGDREIEIYLKDFKKLTEELLTVKKIIKREQFDVVKITNATDVPFIAITVTLKEDIERDLATLLEKEIKPQRITFIGKRINIGGI